MEVPAEEPEETNAAPELGNASYDFSVAEDAATGAAVGTVSATDADSDSLFPIIYHHTGFPYLTPTAFGFSFSDQYHFEIVTK